MNKHNDLHDFMQALSEEMKMEYLRIRKRTKDDPGTAGDEGEGNWARTFREFLPSNYHVVTKGRIMGIDGTASPQVDVIILHPFYPEKMREKKVYLAAGVVAAFECKNTLKAAHIKKAISTSIEIKRLVGPTMGSYLDEMYCPIAYGLLAHSHNWNKKGTVARDKISQLLETEDADQVTSPYDQLDFVCVNDVATWSIMKKPMSWDIAEGENNITWKHGPLTGYNLQAKDIYISDAVKRDNFTPIGALLTKILLRMAMMDNSLAAFSNYYRSVLAGTSVYRPRMWSENALSDTAKAGVDALPQDWKSLMAFTDF